jgi:hypothetical protein
LRLWDTLENLITVNLSKTEELRIRGSDIDRRTILIGAQVITLPVREAFAAYPAMVG